MKRVMIALILGTILLISACAHTGRVVDSINTCEDSDGDDKMVRGTVTYYDAIAGEIFVYEDECVKPKVMKEGVCRDGKIAFEYEECHPSSSCRYGHCRFTRT